MPLFVKLLHITATLDPAKGGVAEAVKSFISIAEQYPTIINEVVTLDGPGSNYLQSEYTSINSLGPSYGFLKHSRILLPWLIKNISRFDAVIINGLWSYHSYAVWKAIKKLKADNQKTPLVFVMPHGMLDPYFQRAKHRWLKAIRNKIYWQLIEKSVINDADGLLFTCEAELLLARETFYFYKPKKEYNVGYGIKKPPIFNAAMQAEFSEACLSLNGEPYLLFLGRIDIKKGVDLLVKAYIALYKAQKILNETLPKLVIAGPGLDSDFCEKVVNEIAQFPEISQQIILPGMLTGNAKWGAFYGCEAFILPSHQENFGIAVVEALACGKPVLISNQVNIWSEINKADAGIVGDDDLEGVERMLQTWLTLSADKKAQMSVNALSAYQKHFTLSETAREMINVIRNDVNKGMAQNVHSPVYAKV
jgi:glycosyltransferase involved in cell wall biosynthesis